MSISDQHDRQIRKLRKFLRQIERLELSDRDLNDEELRKISKKEEIRWHLLDILNHDLISEENDENSINISELSDTNLGDVPSDSKCTTAQSHQPTQNDDLNNTNEQEVENCEMKRKLEDIEDKDPISLSSQIEVKQDSTQHDSPTKITKSDNIQSETQSILSNDISSLINHKFIAYELSGHNDIVYEVATNGKYIVTCSRDTTIKVWSVDDGSEMRSLGGHTGSVSCVKLINTVFAENLKSLMPDDSDSMIISSSQDCTVKFWSLKQGSLLKSIYTFNPVSALEYFEESDLLVIGTGGGKIELWDIHNQNAVHSLKAHDDLVSSIKLNKSQLCSVSNDGVVKLFSISTGQVHLLYESEVMKSEDGKILSKRPIQCLLFLNDLIYFGDDGMNIKIVDWRNGFIKKLSNHKTAFGSTDAICHHNDFIYSSGYDIDNAVGYVNVRHAKDNSYIATIDDGDTSKILSLAVSNYKEDNIVIVTGGWEVKMWKQMQSYGEEDVDLVFAVNVIKDYAKTPVHSDVDSDEDTDNEELGFTHTRVSKTSKEPDSQTSSWSSYCSIL